MNNLNNLSGIPMGAQQPGRPFTMQFQNQLGAGKPNAGPVDYSWQGNITREMRDGHVKQLYRHFFSFSRKVANLLIAKISL